MSQDASHTIDTTSAGLAPATSRCDRVMNAVDLAADRLCGKFGPRPVFMDLRDGELVDAVRAGETSAVEIADRLRRRIERWA